MAETGVKVQAGALLQKSWNFQKRNVGSNICLCAAPIFFCAILAIMQGLINNILLDSDRFKCGCMCTKCCPEWALQSQSGNFTADGSGQIVIPASNAAAWEPNLNQFLASQVTKQPDGSITINTCSPVNSGACPEDDWKCFEKDKSKCGLQFSSAIQSAFCPIPDPSVWPTVMQVPERSRRAKPFPGARAGTVGFPVTSASTASQQLGDGIFRGQITANPAKWEEAILNLYGSDGNGSNYINGEQLSMLGFQFGTDADPQTSLYVERAFSAGEGLFILVPNPMCESKGITTADAICFGDFLKEWFKGTPMGDIIANSPLADSCSGSQTASSNSSSLINIGALRVYCTQTYPMIQDSTDQLEDLLYCGYYQARCDLNNLINNEYMTAYDFQNSEKGKLNMNFYNNGTFDEDSSGNEYTSVLRLPGFMSAGIASWWEQFTKDADPADNGLEALGVMSMPKAASKLRLDFSSLLGPLFYCWVVQLLLPTMLQQLVYEKEKRLRMMMKMHGLGDVAYWVVTYLWFLLLYIVYIAIFIIVGAAINLKIFRRTKLGIQIIFYLLFGNCMISFAFLLSSIFTSTKTAVVVAFLYVFATGLLGELLLRPFMGDDRSWLFYVQWVPAFSLYRGLWEMSEYTFMAEYTNSDSGLTFSKLGDDGNDMATTWGIFAVLWAIFLPLGWYLEQVLPNGTGIRRRPLFFIDWMWRKHESHLLEAHPSLDKPAATSDAKLLVSDPNELEDVNAEGMRVENLTDYGDHPIVIKDLKKIYPGLDGGKPKLAVRSLTMGIRRGECLGLLGPNGAGKTTSINMMTGFLEPTAGTGIVEGHDIHTDMPAIYKLMGVCPQHDLLWDQLSGREHLRFYGRLKGLAGAELEAAVDTALKGVNLYNAGVGDKQAGKYSGGMKRRLSVAISFIGSPKVVYLDEPSTGLDPASRRNLWDVVQTSKAGRAIILTTHSMQEAELLCDRLGIFVDGQLVCIGAPREITSRYAGFLVFTITVAPECEGAARQFVSQLSPNAVLTYAVGGTLKYELPTSEVSLAGVFAAMAEHKERLKVADWAVANATLEEVFIKLASNLGVTSAGR